MKQNDIHRSPASKWPASKWPASKWLDGCLRIVVAIQCLGLSGSYLFSPNERESDVFEWLLFDWGWPEPVVQTIDNTGVWLTLAAGGLLCVIGWIKHQSPAHDASSRSWLCWLDELAAWWIAGWVFLITFAHMIRATLWAELTLAEDAVRYIAPLVLVILIRHPVSIGATGTAGIERTRATRVAMGLLLIAASATFAAHGYKAMMCYGPFTDLILLSNRQWTHFDLSQGLVERILAVIGVMDLLIAVLLIVTRWRTVAFYMALWGTIAAASRMTAYGMNAWPDTLLRAANGGVPLAILGYWQITYWAQRQSRWASTQDDAPVMNGRETNCN